MTLNRGYASEKNSCAPCQEPYHQGTMLPEQSVQVCNNKSCNTDFVNKNGSEKYSYSQLEASSVGDTEACPSKSPPRASSITFLARKRHFPHCVEQPVLRLTSSTDLAPAHTSSRIARSVTPLQIQTYIAQR